MKRFLLLLLCLIFLFCGCNSSDTTEEKQKITINIPTDNTVNGYRTEDSSMPDIISGSELSPSGEITVSSSYCGNKNSKKFHKSSCSALKNTKDENKVYFKTKEDFLQNGYTPCKLCNP